MLNENEDNVLDENEDNMFIALNRISPMDKISPKTGPYMIENFENIIEEKGNEKGAEMFRSFLVILATSLKLPLPTYEVSTAECQEVKADILFKQLQRHFFNPFASIEDEDLLEEEMLEGTLEDAQNDRNYLHTLMAMYLLLELKKHYNNHPELQQTLAWIPKFIKDYMRLIEQYRPVTNPMSIVSPIYEYGVTKTAMGFISATLLLQFLMTLISKVSNDKNMVRSWQDAGFSGQFARMAISIMSCYLMMYGLFKLFKDDWQYKHREAAVAYNDLRFQLLKSDALQVRNVNNNNQSVVNNQHTNENRPI